MTSLKKFFNDTFRPTDYETKLKRSKIAAQLKRVLAVADTVAQNVILLRDKPRLTDYIGLGTRLTYQIISHVEHDADDYFYDTDDWVNLCELSYARDIILACRKYPTRHIGGDMGAKIMITTLPSEIEIGWIDRTITSIMNPPGTQGGSANYAGGEQTRHDSYEGPFIRAVEYEAAYAAMGDALWDQLNTDRITLTTVLSTSEHGSCTANVRIQADESSERFTASSGRGNDILERIKLFNDHDYNRSVMLVGPPGTGKTTLMKYIAKQLNKRTMCITVGDFSTISTYDIIIAIQLLRPEVLLIDDFDRFGHTTAVLLTQLELVNRSVKVFMVSINDMRQLDPAAIRPGRFDEIIEITTLDADVTRQLLSAVPERFHHEFATWPVAYIAEFAKRYKVLGEDLAMKELRELKCRIDHINEQYSPLFGGVDDMLDDESDLTDDDMDELPGIEDLNL